MTTFLEPRDYEEYLSPSERPPVHLLRILPASKLKTRLLDVTPISNQQVSFFDKSMSKRMKQSAGLLMFRERHDGFEAFLVHPGGPYWSKKNEGSWTVPKGEYEEGEEALAAAQREFAEETGFNAHGPFFELGSVRQKSGKIVHAWAFAGDCDPTKLVSNTCEVEWPPRSKQRIVIPEVDRGAWFTPEDAAIFIRDEQQPFLDRLTEHLSKQ